MFFLFEYRFIIYNIGFLIVIVEVIFYYKVFVDYFLDVMNFILN